MLPRVRSLYAHSGAAASAIRLIPVFPLIIMASVAYVNLVPNSGVLPASGTDKASAWQLPCSSFRWWPAQNALSQGFSRSKWPRSWNSFQNAIIFHSAFAEFHEKQKNINYKSHRSCQTNFNVAVCLKFFTLLRLRKHFLCAGRGRVWNLLSVLFHLPVILYKIPPFFFPFKMQTLKPFYLNRSFRGGVQGAAAEISQMTRLGVQVWGFQGICFLRSSFSPFPHTSEKGERCRKGKKATVFNHRFLRNFLFSF